ncbi:hypothetical protein ACS5NO_20645 [Larkinella sp. GY13]|uniref:hypothetical protein n=1 Tax=Larkinella sp. GY13 TaxID=3453720 RepID=UPI003EED2E6E
MTAIQIILAYFDGSLALMNESVLQDAQRTIDTYIARLIRYQELDGIDTEKDRKLLSEVSDFLTAARSLQLH